MTNSATALNIGVVGAGGFANFAARCFVDVEGISVVAVADTDAAAAAKMAETFGAKSFSNIEELLADPAVDLVYIATPPSLHFEQSRLALLSEKHVICEKPAALTTRQAEHLSEIAKCRGILYVVNLMQRYNPLFSIVKHVVSGKLLGDFLHGFFENYASDEFLDQNHWFWDTSLSGGIFIEHGVHFFDLFSGWLGEGEVLYSAKWNRPGCEGTKVLDRVMAIVNYRDGPVSFYHGFDQPKVLDRQEMRLQFERGDITLYGWVPVRMKLTGLLDGAIISRIESLFESAEFKPQSGGSVDSAIQPAEGDHPIVHSGERVAKGRFKEICYDFLGTVNYGNEDRKMSVYADLLKRMIADQKAWIEDKLSERMIDERNAVESLRVAETSESSAIEF